MCPGQCIAMYVGKRLSKYLSKKMFPFDNGPMTMSAVLSGFEPGGNVPQDSVPGQCVLDNTFITLSSDIALPFAWGCFGKSIFDISPRKSESINRGPKT